jgi:hypothetical protein
VHEVADEVPDLVGLQAGEQSAQFLWNLPR